MRHLPRRGFAQDFILSPTKQYRYLPSAPLAFTKGKLCLYRHEGFTARGMYLGRVGLAAASIGAVMPYATIINTALLGITSLHLIGRCRLVREVRLLESGKELEIDYSLLPFVRRTVVMPIRDLSNPPAWPLISLWNLKPLGNNMSATLEAPVDELFPWYIPTASHFYLFPKHPSTCHLDILASALLGVHIDPSTVKPKSHSLAHHYLVS